MIDQFLYIANQQISNRIKYKVSLYVFICVYEIAYLNEKEITDRAYRIYI